MTGQTAEAAKRVQTRKEIRRLNVELEARVRERTAQIEAANRDIEELASAVSHDLRAPLRAIDGFSSLLLARLDDRLDADERHQLELVRDSAKQMAALLDDMLDFSRVGLQAAVKKPIHPADVVALALDDLRHEREGREVEVTVGAMCEVHADPAQLRQVFVNLVGNALKYTRQRSTARIEIGCSEVGGACSFYVRDNGIGFELADADRLFRVYNRGADTGDVEGTGMGLAIVRRIVEQHGGRVWAESEVGRGATFWFTLGEAPDGGCPDGRSTGGDRRA